MKISSLQNFQQSFRNAKNAEKNDDKNPISKRGEEATLFKATAIAGLALGGRALLWLCEEGTVFDVLVDKSFDYGIKDDKLAPKAGSAGKSFALFAMLTAGFVAAVALVYTIYKTPEIVYQSNVNAFKKGKDMDVYVKGNKVERELYEQMNDKAKTASFEEKKKLAVQYLKLRAAKNQLPDFIVGDDLSKLKVKKAKLEKN